MRHHHTSGPQTAQAQLARTEQGYRVSSSPRPSPRASVTEESTPAPAPSAWELGLGRLWAVPYVSWECPGRASEASTPDVSCGRYRHGIRHRPGETRHHVKLPATYGPVVGRKGWCRIHITIVDWLDRARCSNIALALGLQEMVQACPK
eukprot:scaffold29647_cov145-Isochrysis_galbana.AAC.6